MAGLPAQLCVAAGVGFALGSMIGNRMWCDNSNTSVATLNSKIDELNNQLDQLKRSIDDVSLRFILLYPLFVCLESILSVTA